MKPFILEDFIIGAKTVWGEARGEPWPGKLAVANVIVNRVSSRRYPNTISGVCQQPYQFSCWNKNDPNRTKLDSLSITTSDFRDCVAAMLWAYSLVEDKTNGALHYHAKSVSPYWARGKTPSYQAGNHLFYNDVD